jgi:alpha/beta superfamily hydrolase
MARRIEQLMIDGPVGRIEALLEEPESSEPTYAALVCHPHPQHGGTMHNKVVYRLARGLRGTGAVTLRFNYRGVNLSEGVYDNGRGETDDARAALAYLRGRYPALPFALAGFSFGSRIAHRLACDASEAKFVIPVGMPTWYFENEDIVQCPTPRVFIQSTNDQFGPREKFQAAYDTLAEPKRLIWVEAPDHFFAGELDAFEAAVKAATV